MTMPKKNKALVFGVIGGGVAVAVTVIVMVVLFVMTPPPQQQPALTPEQQQRKEVLNTPNTGQPGQTIIQHQELRALANWCDPMNTPTYHAAKCEYVHIIQELWADVLR